MNLESLIIPFSFLCFVWLVWMIFKRRPKKKRPIINQNHQFVANTYIGTTRPEQEKKENNPMIATEFYPLDAVKKSDISKKRMFYRKK